MTNRYLALIACLLLPVVSPLPLLLVSSATTASLLTSAAPAQAQSADVVAKVAQAITVRIEGATQGSGVLVKREGNRYTVLTAWHVVEGQRPGEELAVYTVNGQEYQVDPGSIRQIGNSDLAELSFSSSNVYVVARGASSPVIGSPIYVFGYEVIGLDNVRAERLELGYLKANPESRRPDGYQLLYSSQTGPGMSGGPVLNANGDVIGIHGRAESYDALAEKHGKTIATGTNMGIPLSIFSSQDSNSNRLETLLSTWGVEILDHEFSESCAQSLLVLQNRLADLISLGRQPRRSMLNYGVSRDEHGYPVHLLLMDISRVYASYPSGRRLRLVANYYSRSAPDAMTNFGNNISLHKAMAAPILKRCQQIGQVELSPWRTTGTLDVYGLALESQAVIRFSGVAQSGPRPLRRLSWGQAFWDY